MRLQPARLFERLGCLGSLAAALAFTGVRPSACGAADLAAPGAAHYRIRCDLVGGQREVALRLEAIFHNCRQNAASWGDDAAPTGPPPTVDLFRSAADYRAAGGPPGSSGVFLPDTVGGRVLVWVGPRLNLATWHALQHEAFHAYVHETLDQGGRAPLWPWLEEGLADRCGEALFTGDGMVDGLAPPWRVARLRQELAQGKLPPLDELLSRTPAQWRAAASVTSYDQAWSVVHFLLSKQQPDYQRKLVQAVHARSMDPLGPIPVLQQQWQRYWMNQPADPTAGRYALAIAQTFNAFRVRAAVGGQSFDSYRAFRAAAATLKLPDRYWLPPTLLSETVDVADDVGPWTFTAPRGGSARLEVELPDGTRAAAGYVLQSRDCWDIWSRLDPVPPSP